MALTSDRATVRRRGTVAVIDLPGQIDISAEATLNDAYKEAERVSATIEEAVIPAYGLGAQRARKCV